MILKKSLEVTQDVYKILSFAQTKECTFLICFSENQVTLYD